MVLQRFLPALTAPFEHAPTCDLEKIAMEHKGNGFHKWHHYMAIYDRYLSQFRGKSITVLEIGVDGGGSLQLWQTYFGESATIHGADQSDPKFLQYLIDKIAPFDIIIDDGSHVGAHQILGFETLFPHIKDGGIYICEDLHASYWSNYGGGLNNTNKFTDYIKNMIDRLHKWYQDDMKSSPADFVTNTVKAIHMYDSIVVIEKNNNIKPKPIAYGRIGEIITTAIHPQKN